MLHILYLWYNAVRSSNSKKSKLKNKKSFYYCTGICAPTNYDHDEKSLTSNEHYELDVFSVDHSNHPQENEEREEKAKRGRYQGGGSGDAFLSVMNGWKPPGG